MKNKKDDPEAGPKYPIESVDNALRLLLAVGDRREMGVSEASDYLGVAPSTAHRLLAMLAHYGFVEQDPVHKVYRAGPALVQAGLSALKDLDIRSQARPHIEALVEAIGETAHLVALQGSDVLFLDCVEGDRALRAGSRTGQVLPAHCTAAGKALLAALPDDRLDVLYADDRLPKLTESSLTTKSALRKELATVRTHGYATNQNESEADLRAVAVAVPDPTGRTHAAVTVAAPDHRMSTRDFPAVAKSIERCVEGIAANLR